MSRRKNKASSFRLSEWMSCTPDCKEKRFVQLGTSLLQCEAFHSLPAGARMLYIFMVCTAAGRPRFWFDYTTARDYCVSETSFYRNRDTLVQNGFIVPIALKGETPCNFEFGTGWKHSAPTDSVQGLYNLKFWCSCAPRCAERSFILIGESLLKNPAFQSLTGEAQFCYLVMANKSRGSDHFILPSSVAQTYGLPHRTFVRCVAQLENRGFIRSVSGRYARKPSDYWFVSGWKEKVEPPATTNDRHASEQKTEVYG